MVFGGLRDKKPPKQVRGLKIRIDGGSALGRIRNRAQALRPPAGVGVTILGENDSGK